MEPTGVSLEEAGRKRIAEAARKEAIGTWLDR